MRIFLATFVALLFWTADMRAVRIDFKALRNAIELPSVDVTHGFTLSHGFAFVETDIAAEIAKREKNLTKTASDADTLMEISGYQLASGNPNVAQKTIQNAIIHFDHQLNVNPRDTKAWIGKGNACRKLELFDEADKCYNKAIEIAPDDGIVWTAFGVYYEARAIQSLLCNARNKSDPQPPLDAMERLVSEGKVLKDNAEKAEIFLAAALSCHDKAVRLSPNEAKVYYARACSRSTLSTWGTWIRRVLHGETQPPTLISNEVLSDLLHAAQLDPSYVQLSGIAVSAAEDVSQRINKQGTTAMSVAADLMHETPGDAQELIPRLMKRLEDAARCSDATRASDASGILGYLFFMKGDRANAMIHYARAVELDPTRDVAWDMLTAIAASGRDKDSYVRVCEKRISVHATARAYYLLGKAYAGVGQIDSAETAMRTGAKLAPQDYNTAMGVAVLLLKRADTPEVLTAARDQYEKAVKLLKTEVATSHQRAEMLVVGGVLAANFGDIERAAQLVREAVELDRNMYTLNIMTLLTNR